MFVDESSTRVFRQRRHRRGTALVYATIFMSLAIGLAAFSVDVGRVMSAKSELQGTTDAAARYAASAMRTMSGTTSAAGANASAVFAQNKVDGTVAPFDPNTDLTLGVWTPATRTFVPTTIALGANAVRLQTKMTLGDTARPLSFASILGLKATIHGNSIVMMNGTVNSAYVAGKGNPWLAGMPDGTVTNNYTSNVSTYDVAGPTLSSPGMMSLAAAQMIGGSVLTFNSVAGTSGNGSGSTQVANADGNANQIVSLGTNGTSSVYTSRPMNGMSNVRAPINSMIAVFLDDNRPDTTGAPAALDFMDPTQRDYQSISPTLKQTFFIGDGRRSSTGEVQQIVVPPGATRLFIGNMDAWQWNDNTGGYTATANTTISVVTVK